MYELTKGDVAPLAGAWIEIGVGSTPASSSYVAPLAGAWIEIGWRINELLNMPSLPSRERGLKFWWV